MRYMIPIVTILFYITSIKMGYPQKIILNIGVVVGLLSFVYLLSIFTFGWIDTDIMSNNSKIVKNLTIDIIVTGLFVIFGIICLILGYKYGLVTG